ncbi:hypothetical protein LNKW23_47740 [Paralimibaculum aggregatum]|uniref:YdhG-like domain-containing protein n=1 Tax=Paralimibaculum aggregatum TaxID=3036245 RepID=A0ABQ6LU28_9RHOB|nr:DUF1801 domain-containing protein [Limibaculum sp. NKW23]GMG85551.1 hypothetical protein LNKW23_47740 [Limibaculum sp. NKW23]
MAEEAGMPGEVAAFLAAVEPETRRADALSLLGLMQAAAGEAPALWPGGIVGFGIYAYTYASGHSGRSFLTGFAPRKRALTLYIMPGFAEMEDLLARLGRHTRAKSCLHLGRLADVDAAVLGTLVARSVEIMRARHGG